MGLRTLAKLNEMSGKIGQLTEVIIRNIFNLIADPKRTISGIVFAIMCYHQGKIFKINTFYKDVLLGSLFLIVLGLFVLRKRL